MGSAHPGGTVMKLERGESSRRKGSRRRRAVRGLLILVALGALLAVSWGLYSAVHEDLPALPGAYGIQSDPSSDRVYVLHRRGIERIDILTGNSPTIHASELFTGFTKDDS